MTIDKIFHSSHFEFAEDILDIECLSLDIHRFRVYVGRSVTSRNRPGQRVDHVSVEVSGFPVPDRDRSSNPVITNSQVLRIVRSKLDLV